MKQKNVLVKRRPNAKFDIGTEKLICSLYQESLLNSSVKLSKLFNCVPTTILIILRRNGITPRNNSTSQIGLRLGKDSPNYKGGTTSDGYLRIFINGKSIYKHRLIMEEYLGRKLTSADVIHHKNRNKLDNRIENLELMTRSQHAKEHWYET